MISSGNLPKADGILAIFFAFALRLSSITPIVVTGDISSTSDAKGGGDEDGDGDGDAAISR